MHVELRTAAAIRAKLKPLIDSKAYWTLLLPPEGFDIGIDLEKRFYQAEANTDFHLSLGPLGPYPVVAVVVCHKKWLPSKAFLKVLRKHGGRPRRGFQLGDRDVLIPDFGNEATCQQLAAGFYCWLADLRPELN